MTFDILLLLVLLAAALALFVTERLPLEVTASSLLAALLLLGLVSLDEAIAGLSNRAVVTVGAMFVMGHALVKTGALEVAADRLSQRLGSLRWLALAVPLAVASLLSAVLNNTAVVAIFIPLAMDLCRRLELSPSRVLLPLSYVAIFGGTLTLIGTSTNLLVSALAVDGGGQPIGMFEPAPMGLVFVFFGFAYVFFFGPRLLPDRGPSVSLTSKYQMSDYLTEVRVLPTSKLVGRTVREADLNRRFEVTVLGVLRGEEAFTEDLRALPLSSGDLLIVRGAMERLQRLRADQGVALVSDFSPGDDELAEAEQSVVEALVPPNSSLIGATLEEVEFRRRYRAFVLAIRRHGSTLRTRLARTPLAFSDTLLLVTPRKRLDELRQRDELVVTSELDLQLRPHRFWWLILVLLPAVVVGAGLGLFDIAAGALVACVLLLVAGALEPREAYRAVDWSVLFFIAAFIPLGDAMFNTGAADYLASLLLSPLGVLPPQLAPWAAVSALYLFTSLFTEVVSNNATAIVFTPLAIAMAHELGVDSRPFVFAVCFAASASFMTPTGYQTNMMVYGPGGYRFGDFVRFGAPLNLLFWVIASLLIPRFWSF